jgi:hypothetical protein
METVQIQVSEKTAELRNSAHFVARSACSEMLHYLDQMDNYLPYLYTALHIA